MAQTFQTPIWTPLKLDRLRLRGTPWDPSDKKLAPSLLIFVSSGYVTLQVYLNKGTASDALNVRFDSPIRFFELLEALEEVTNASEKEMIIVDSSTWFNGRNRLESPALVAKVAVGRDAEGFVYLALTFKGEKPAKFTFNEHQLSTFVGSDGERLPNARKSNIAARAWIKFYRKTIAEEFLLKTVEPVKKDKPGNSQPSGQSGFSEDLPTWPSF